MFLSAQGTVAKLCVNSRDCLQQVSVLDTEHFNVHPTLVKVLYSQWLNVKTS